MVAFANDVNATVEYLDADDMALSDGDPFSPGIELSLGDGDTTIKVKVTNGTATKTYTIVVTQIHVPRPQGFFYDVLPAGRTVAGIGNQVRVGVEFSEIVTVDTTSGTPSVEITHVLDDVVNLMDVKTATYVSGSGTFFLNFTYTVAEGDEATAVDILVDAIDLNGGTIVSTDAGIPAKVLLTGFLDTGDDLNIDGVRPTLKSAGTSRAGTEAHLFFSETLDASNGPANSDFTVKADGTAVDLTGSPNVSGSTVVLTLATGVAADETVTVSYTDPSAGNDTNAIQDEAGNDAESFSDESVVNNTGRPFIESIVFTPTTSEQRFGSFDLVNIPGDDHTYVQGDTVHATVTFSEAVTVAGSPQLVLDFDGTPKTAQYASGSRTTELVFTYTVRENDVAPDGIAVGTNKLSLNRGRIIATANTRVTANLDHVSVANDPEHKVDAVRPRILSARTSTDGWDVLLTFDEPLLAKYQTFTTDFIVKVGGNPMTIDGPRTFVEGDRTVRLPMASAITPSQAVSVSYNDGRVDDCRYCIQDAAGNDADPFADETVTNIVDAGSTGPQNVNAADARAGESAGEEQRRRGQTRQHQESRRKCDVSRGCLRLVPHSIHRPHEPVQRGWGATRLRLARRAPGLPQLCLPDVCRNGPDVEQRDEPQSSRRRSPQGDLGPQ